MITLEWSVAVDEVEVYFRGYGEWFVIDVYSKQRPVCQPHKFSNEYRGYCAGIFYLPEDEKIKYRYEKTLEGITTLLPILKHPDNHYIISALNQDGADASDFYFAIDKSEQMFIQLNNPSKSITDEVELPNSVRNSLLKIIIGMAIDGYKYDPDDNKNSLTGSKKDSFSDKFNKLGIQITDETIRKYLKEAESFIPQDYKNRKT
jgi:hypothetical protein